MFEAELFGADYWCTPKADPILVVYLDGDPSEVRVIHHLDGSQGYIQSLIKPPE